MDIYFEFEQSIDSEFLLRIEAVREYREKISTAIDRASHAAGIYMADHVPFDSGELYRAINVGPVVFRPGGAFGGGFYEARVSVDESRAPHAQWVIEGTGIFGPTGSRISPAKGNIMAFTGSRDGAYLFRHSVAGQEPQREWFENAMELADRVVRQELAR